MALILLLSPAKRLRLPKERPSVDSLTKPVFLAQAKKVMGQLKPLGIHDLVQMQSISPELARENVERNQSWKGARRYRAVELFDGEVYRGLAVARWSESARQRAQGHLRILSGLYGWLRPDDGIEPYRLEMGTALEIEPGKRLGKWWSEPLSARLKREAGRDWVVDLSSAEYGGVLRYPKGFQKKVSMDFLEDGPKGPRPVQVYFKQARGTMARWILETGAQTPTDFEAFQEDGYRFSPLLSKPGNMVFLRNQ
ncbi:peroxide stress protein YaaA [bacterium]|nr:peroxide stress protein YaaA [bacterium]